ncbi:uncharacterized protein LOC121367489 isoform X2 [Gigantopelta aegis]|uniref:uncharacterized protein LOC121367489 isoform X2 n=1 Tax=Gigantopelta aegis TaxID=1735272 RepID=UPI001B88A327|nr:uncharacterized protein LOC121367489 isoform X2 [Gigantopelta aegis]
MSDTSKAQADSATAVTSDDKADVSAVMSDSTADVSADVPSVMISSAGLPASSDSNREKEQQASVKESESEKGIKDEQGEGEKMLLNPLAPAASQAPVMATSSYIDLNAQPSIAKVSSSHDLVFETKKKKRKVDVDPNCHSVTFTVNIAMAVPTDSLGKSRRKHTQRAKKADVDLQQDTDDQARKKKRVMEAPRAQNYYHLEYVLLPDDDDLTKTDLVTYGMAAKIYMERHDARVIKTWVDGEVTWVAWANSHTLTVTREVLLQMFNHRLEVRVWDTKDKVSTRARFDRPKAFRLPHGKPGEDADEIGGVKGLVLKQMNSFTKIQPAKAVAVRPLPTLITFPKDNMHRRKGYESKVSKDQKQPYSPPSNKREKSPQSAASPRSPRDRDTLTPTPKVLKAIKLKNSCGQDVRTFSRLGNLAGAERPTNSSKGSKGSRNEERRSQSSKKSSKSHKSHPSPSRPESILRSVESETSMTKLHKELSKRKVDAEAHAAVEHAKVNGVCSVPIRMAMLFSGMRCLTGRLDKPVVGIEDMFVTVSLDGPLMSDQQKQDLNPMIIKLISATGLPQTPISYEELRFKCHPVYCKYTFHQQPEHLTSGKEHDRNIYWDDINVVLLGTMEPRQLKEYLNGPAMEIEVHDRDRKEEEVSLKPTLFGDDLEDEKISNVGTVASRRTLYNPFEGRDKPWDPYGVARLDLSELLLGHHLLYMKVPIHNCLIPDVLGQDGKHDGKLIGISGAVDGPVDRPLLAGHYFKASSSLKVKVELSFPLTNPQPFAIQLYALTNQCPFGRIVFIFDYKNVKLLHKLQKMITAINAHSLELDDMPDHVIDAALSTYKLSDKQISSPSLDIITGFQVMDGSMHMYVLEGLIDKAVHLLWEALPQPENEDVRVLFNSDVSFSSRLYGPLDVDLCRIKLHEPLSIITEQSLLYVRDMVPKPCFQALVKLKELSTMKTLKDAVRNDVFPTTEMIISMSREFGVPLTVKDFEELQDMSDKLPVLSSEKLVSRPHTSRQWTPIDNFNEEFLKRIGERKNTSPASNFIKDNIDDVHVHSIKNRQDREKTKPVMVQVDANPAHNYSTQRLNTGVLAAEKIRLMLAQNPDTRYTYSQAYNNMTVIPVDPEEFRKEELENMRSRWRTDSGFIYPGKKTMIQSNVHPDKPDDARLEELTYPWKENILHVNILQSPLKRERFPWDYRHHDIELYRRPLPDFGVTQPMTIHLAGEKLRQEKLQEKLQDLKTWQSKIVVDDTAHHVHRVLPETEMRDRGFYSSNQIDRLQGLLKDPPIKHTLCKPGLVLRKIPPLNVVLNPKVDTDARAEGLPLFSAVRGEEVEKTRGFKPGPFITRSWLMENNKIPAVDYEHGKLIKLKGKDFNLYNRDCQYLFKRNIEPLSEEDRDNHLFYAVPADSGKSVDSFNDSGIVPDMAERSYTQPAFGSPSDVTLTCTSPDLKPYTQGKKLLDSVAC